MTEPVEPTRRRLLALLGSTGLAALFSAPGLERGIGAPRDQGIGGTGAAPPSPDDADRGIGGTGVIGTIKKFGSIYVNDLRIAYPENAEVRIDGRPAALGDLKLGQVVRVQAKGEGDALSTRRIDITHEVVGPLESQSDKRLVVLGQTVSTEDLPPRSFAVGETVAVSGLRRNDGTIVASLIEPRPGAVSRVSGPVVRVGRTLRIGALPLDGVRPQLIGRRASLVGRQQDGVFVVTRGESDASPFPKSVRRLSIESYVEQRDGALALGSGFAVAGAAAGLAAGRSVRAVLDTSFDRRGRLTLDNLRAGGRDYRGPGGRGPGGPAGGGGGGGRGPGGGRGGPGGHGRPGGEHHGSGGSHGSHGGHGGGHGGAEHGGRGPGGGRHGGHGGPGRDGGHGGRQGGPGGGRGFGGGSHGGFGPNGPGAPGGGGFRGGGPGFGGRGFGGGGFGGRGFGGGGFRGGGGRGFGGGGFRGGGGGFGGGRR